MTTDGVCFIHEYYITMQWPLSRDDDNWRSMMHTLGVYKCSDRCPETITTHGAWFIPEGYITLLWPLSWDDDNCRSMVHTLGMNNYGMSVVMRLWQLSEHVSYIEGSITMLWPLSWDDDNSRSMIHTWRIYNHALSVVMRRWQLTEHGSYKTDIWQCSDRSHETMATDGAWFIP